MSRCQRAGHSTAAGGPSCGGAPHPGLQEDAVVSHARAQVQDAPVAEQVHELRGQALVQEVVAAHLARLRRQAGPA